MTTTRGPVVYAYEHNGSQSKDALKALVNGLFVYKGV